MFISGWIIAIAVIGLWLVERDNKQKLKDMELSWKHDTEISQSLLRDANKEAIEAWKAQKATEADVKEWKQIAHAAYAANQGYERAYGDALRRLRAADPVSLQAHLDDECLIEAAEARSTGANPAYLT